MQLNNYYTNKTIKLNDSFVVYMHNLQQRNIANKRIATTKAWDTNGNLGDMYNILDGNTASTDDRLIELYTCTDVQLPAYKYKVESHQIGNSYFKVILPDYEAQPTVSLTVAETHDHQIENILKLLIRRNIKDGGTYGMQYVDNGWLDVLAVDVLSNDLHKTVVRYAFGFCRLVSYSVYDLDYKADDLPTYKLTFSFETYKKFFNPTSTNLDHIIFDTRNQIDKLMTTASKYNKQ